MSIEKNCGNCAHKGTHILSDPCKKCYIAQENQKLKYPPMHVLAEPKQYCDNCKKPITNEKIN